LIVVDASAALAGLLNAGVARDSLRTEDLHAPHVVDVEVAHVLRRQVITERLTSRSAARALATFQVLGLRRHPVTQLLGRIWELRNNLSAYDAAYVALAESLNCDLLTADGRLSRAPGLRCPVTVVST
jgi:predicted nucleic acid-binding protein